jgi:hypothetical protein
MKVPNAVETLAEGIADFLRKNRVKIVARIDSHGGKEFEFEFSGNMTTKDIEAFNKMLAGKTSKD